MRIAYNILLYLMFGYHNIASVNILLCQRCTSHAYTTYIYIKCLITIGSSSYLFSFIEINWRLLFCFNTSHIFNWKQFGRANKKNLVNMVNFVDTWSILSLLIIMHIFIIILFWIFFLLIFTIAIPRMMAINFE